MQDAFKPSDFPQLLVGLQSPDDAAVWKIDDQRGLVLTTDFFTPVVDDARDFGRIAAANSLSDVYAMGGTPFLALNIAALPVDLDPEVCAQIFLGGAEIAREAGIVVAGGHSIQDKEPKYGMVAAGFVELDEMITKAGARPGDQLYLTKPLGMGTITTALKRQVARDEDVAEAVRWMTHLNKGASHSARKCGVKGGTDVTGFAFLGHALEMSQASQVAFRVEFDRIPVLDNALRYAQDFIFPGGAFDNRIAFSKGVNFSKELPEYFQMLLFDPQTSGGLLLAVPQHKTGEFERSICATGGQTWRIGEVTEGFGITII
jgi:selenide,water dikinase